MAGRVGIIRTMGQAARNRVSKENRGEYDNEKRAQEIARRMPCGRPEEKAVAVAAMMKIPEKVAEKMIMKDVRGQSKVVHDGKID